MSIINIICSQTKINNLAPHFEEEARKFPSKGKLKVENMQLCADCGERRSAPDVCQT